MSLIDDAYALITVGQSAIGSIIPDCVIEETHRDQVITTDHPTERGAPVTDHAFRQPYQLEMRIGFSNSSAGTEGWIDVAYNLLLALQKARRPITVSTSKRTYQNMLITSIVTTTNQETKSVLLASVMLKELIIADTTATSSPASSQANPQQTASEVNTGTKQLASTSIGRVAGPA